LSEVLARLQRRDEDVSHVRLVGDAARALRGGDALLHDEDRVGEDREADRDLKRHQQGTRPLAKERGEDRADFQGGPHWDLS
jgi:hypothetical protein